MTFGSLLYFLGCAFTIFSISNLSFAIQTALPVEKFDLPWGVVSFVADGELANRNIFCIDFEEDGTAWISTSDGLYRYDGYFWKRFTVNDGLPSDFVRCVRVTSKGEIWAGTDKGVAVFKKYFFKMVDGADQYRIQNVRRIVEDSDGTLWLCCDEWPQAKDDGKLIAFKDGKGEIFQKEDGLPSNYVVDYFKDSLGNQFVLTSEGVAGKSGEDWVHSLSFEKLDAGHWTSADAAEVPGTGVLVSNGRDLFLFKDGKWKSLPNTIVHRYGLCPTHDGELYIIGNKSPGRSSFMRWTAEGFKVTSREFEVPRGFIQDIKEAPDGSIWAAGFDFLVRFKREKSEWRKYINLPPPLFSDNLSRIWFRTKESVVVLDKGVWKNFSVGTESLFLDIHGNVWSWSKTGAALWSGSGPLRYGTAELGLDLLLGIYSGAQGKIWIHGLTQSGGSCFSVFDGSFWKKYSAADTDGCMIRSSSADPEDGIWYLLVPSNRNEPFLLYTDGESSFKKSLPKDLMPFFPPNLYVDTDRNIWIYGDNGLLKGGPERDSNWEQVQDIPGKSVFACTELDGQIWLGYSGSTGGHGGLSSFSNGVWKSFQADIGYAWFRALDGTTFFVGEQKIFMISPSFHDIPVILSLPNSDKIGRIVKDGSGDLWIAQGESVLRFHPDGIPPQTNLEILSEKIYIGDSIHFVAQGIEYFVPRGMNKNFLYSWKFDSGEWTAFDRSPEFTLFTGGMKTGVHNVEVRAMDETMDVDPVPARLKFVLHATPLQQRIWFEPAVVAVFLLLITLALSFWAAKRKISRHALEMEEKVAERTAQLSEDIKNRQRTEKLLRKSREQLRGLSAHLQNIREEERSSLARDLHDELAQSLTAIKIELKMMENTLEKEVGTTIDTKLGIKIRGMNELVDKTIQETRKFIKELRPEIIDDLGLLSAIEWQAQEFKERTGIEVRLISKIKRIDFDRSRAIAVYRIFQESLTNIARHAEASRVTLTISKTKNNLVFEITDNGRGIQKDQMTQAKTYGLLGMRERALMIGGRLNIGLNEDNGTTVKLKLPLD